MCCTLLLATIMIKNIYELQNKVMSFLIRKAIGQTIWLCEERVRSTLFRYYFSSSTNVL